MSEGIFHCDCHAECIVAVADRTGEDWGYEPGEVELAFWRSGQGAPGLRWKLGQIWRFLRHGSLYEDFVLLSPAKAMALADWLLSVQPKKSDVLVTFSNHTPVNVTYTGDAKPRDNSA